MRAAAALAIVVALGACDEGLGTLGAALTPPRCSLAVELGEDEPILRDALQYGPNPTGATLRVTNAGSDLLTVSVVATTRSGGAWLQAAPPGATLAFGEQFDVSIGIDVVGPALTPGTYRGDVVVSGSCPGRTARGSPNRTTVRLTVIEPEARLASGDGLSVDVTPLSDTWSTLPVVGAPPGTVGGSAVWTGREVVVFGGADDAGVTARAARYSPLEEAWRTAAAAPVARRDHCAVWTGERMLVWGGSGANGAALGSGHAYDPVTDTWTPLPSAGAPSPRSRCSAVWTGTAMIVFGGRLNSGTYAADGASYNPVAGTWQALPGANAPTRRAEHVAIWTGREMIVWGGRYANGVRTNGAAFDPAAGTWRTLARSGAPDLALTTAVWTGDRVLLWGGVSGDGTSLSGLGAAYDPGADTWSPFGPINAPLARRGHRAVWTGNRLLVWGGSDPTGNLLASGGAYSPADDTWSGLDGAGAPSARVDHQMVWDGVALFVWGGFDTTGLANSGGAYR